MYIRPAWLNIWDVFAVCFLVQNQHGMSGYCHSVHTPHSHWHISENWYLLGNADGIHYKDLKMGLVFNGICGIRRNRLVSAWWMIVSAHCPNKNSTVPRYVETDIDVISFIVERDIVHLSFPLIQQVLSHWYQLFAHDLSRSSIMHIMHQLTIGWMSIEYHHLHLAYASIAYI